MYTTHVFNHVYNYWWLFPKYAASSSQTNTQTWSCTEELGCVNMCHEIKMSFKVGRTCSKHDPLMERGRKADQRWVCWLSYNSWVSHGNRSKGRGTKARWVEVTGCSLTTMKRRSSRSSLYWKCTSGTVPPHLFSHSWLKRKCRCISNNTKPESPLE